MRRSYLAYDLLARTPPDFRKIAGCGGHVVSPMHGLVWSKPHESFRWQHIEERKWEERCVFRENRLQKAKLIILCRLEAHSEIGSNGLCSLRPTFGDRFIMWPAATTPGLAMHASVVSDTTWPLPAIFVTCTEALVNSPKKPRTIYREFWTDRIKKDIVSDFLPVRGILEPYCIVAWSTDI